MRMGEAIFCFAMGKRCVNASVFLGGAEREKVRQVETICSHRFYGVFIVYNYCIQYIYVYMYYLNTDTDT